MYFIPICNPYDDNGMIYSNVMASYMSNECVQSLYNKLLLYLNERRVDVPFHSYYHIQLFIHIL